MTILSLLNKRILKIGLDPQSSWGWHVTWIPDKRFRGWPYPRHPEGAYLYFATEGTPHFAVACKNKHRPTICNDGNAKYWDSLRTCAIIPHFGMTVGWVILRKRIQNDEWLQPPPSPWEKPICNWRRVSLRVIQAFISRHSCIFLSSFPWFLLSFPRKRESR